MAFLGLIHEGNLGLIRAMADQAHTIRIPVHMVEVNNKLGRIQRELLQDDDGGDGGGCGGGD